MPLREQWMAATQALAGDKAPTALALLRDFQDWYGNEPEAQDPQLQEALHRLWGLAALESGQLEEGILHLEKWLADYPEVVDFRAFLRFQTAAACRAAGDLSRSRFHAEAFLEEFPDLPERALVRWQLAELDLFENQLDSARRNLLSVEEDAALPASGQTLARAALALLDLQAGRIIEAHQWLAASAVSDTGDQAASDLLGIWRSVLAPALVVQLMQGEEPFLAAGAAAWFDHPVNLKRRFARLRPPARRSGARQQVWNSHWLAQLQRMGVAVEQAAADSGNETIGVAAFTPEATLYDLRLRTLLAAGNLPSAAILARALLDSSERVAMELRASAFAAAIEAAQRIQSWAEAESLCGRFLSEYPDHPDLPRILFLQASTAAGRRDFAAAIRSVDQLIVSYPDNPASASWRLAAAGWALDAGAAAAALQRLADLEPLARLSWLPFLRFQSARAFGALEQIGEAIAAYTAAADHPGASPFLREQALTGLLRLHLDKGKSDAFSTILRRYRSEFPDGANRLMVTCLEGNMEERLGRIEKACAAYRTIAHEPEPAAGFAREQLATLLENVRDWNGLRAHLAAWLQMGLLNDLPLPSAAFTAAARLQSASQEPAFPSALAQSLLEAMEAGSPLLPSSDFLAVLAGLWPVWRERLSLEGNSIDAWLDAAAEAHRLAGRLPAFAACQLFLAGRLAAAGRSDSADTRLIEVLQVVDPSSLAPSSHLHLAEVAQRYDFPEAAALLEDFLERYPADAARPQALFLLAGLQRRGGASHRARLLLEEIALRWADAGVAHEACLQLAAWEFQDALPASAASRLQLLLDQPGLPARMVAEALLLRARADVATGDPARAALACRRILALYPDLDTVAVPAAALLASLSPTSTGIGEEAFHEAG